MKKVGDEIAVGEEIVEIETDKANMAYESDVAGTLTEILAEEGATLPIGTPIARVGDGAEGSKASAAGPDGGETPAGEDVASSLGVSPPPPAGEVWEKRRGSKRRGRHRRRVGREREGQSLACRAAHS